MSTFIQENFNTPVMETYDVIVSGGGPAGLAAAISSARLGAKTLLVEKNGWVGGMATSGLVHPFMPSYAGDVPINKGIFWEIIERLQKLHAVVHPDHTEMGTGYTGFVVWPHAHVTPFDAEILKWVVQDLLEESKVDVLLHSMVVQATKEGNKATGIIVENKSGRMGFTGKVLIDATGDGDLAKYLQIPFKKGNEEDNAMQPATIFFRLAGVDRKKIDAYIAEHPEERHFKSFAAKAMADGKFIPSKHDVLFFYTPREGELAINTTRVHGIDGTNVYDLTKAEFEARHQVRVLVEFFRSYVPGFEHAYISSTAPEIGIRETRRIIGEYTLNREDVLEVHQFSDNIAQCAYMIDIHDRKSTQLFYTPVPEGRSYGIPYRCLIPKGYDGILFAGRCISASQEAQGSVRVMPPSFSIGQAAGTAAALAVIHGTSVREVDIALLQKTLVRFGQVVEEPLQDGDKSK